MFFFHKLCLHNRLWLVIKRSEILFRFKILNAILGSCLDESGLNFKNYHGVSTFHKYLECLNRTYPNNVKVFDIGRSTEGRPLKVIKIGTPATDRRVKPAVWIDGGIHAREWVSPATVLYFINQLVENSGSAQNRFVVEQLDLYILPSSNPDG